MKRPTTGRIELNRVWKKFRYGEINNRLRDAIPALVRRMFRVTDPDEGLWKGEFWALRDVSFVVEPGEALGIIGPNGAGKSTILKLVTRIMRPTSGSSTVSGRVGALIEVAAGFHPDLTGTENVYLQGVIMGMPRKEIARKFDQIVEFADIGPFLDTPVKRYSSGMQARLGFAIAAHLEPDVLVVDEALAVGDAAFQAKAFARITELVGENIAVVVVSHQLEAITALCTHALLLDRGHAVRAGTPQECIAAYLHGSRTEPAVAEEPSAVRIDELELSAAAVPSGDWITARFSCSVRDGGWTEPEAVRVRVRLAATGETVFEAGTDRLGPPLPQAGSFRVDFALQVNVAPGIYLVDSLVWNRHVGRVWFVGPSTHLEVREGRPFEGLVQMNSSAQMEIRSDRPE